MLVKICVRARNVDVLIRKHIDFTTAYILKMKCVTVAVEYECRREFGATERESPPRNSET